MRREQTQPGVRLALMFALMAGLVCPLLATAQSVSEYRVKAAYLYNFAKFVDWPADRFATATTPIRLCVLNDSLFLAELLQVVNGKTIAGRPMAVVPVQSAELARSCEILFINSSQNGQTPKVIDALRDTSVLTVGETKGFVQEGGIINFVLQDDRVLFEVNHKAARQAGLSVSSRLLAVAKLVIE